MHYDETIAACEKLDKFSLHMQVSEKKLNLKNTKVQLIAYSKCGSIYIFRLW